MMDTVFRSIISITQTSSTDEIYDVDYDANT